MKKSISFIIHYFFLLIPIIHGFNSEKQNYIVHVNPNPSSSLLTSTQREQYYKSFLPSKSHLIYSYHEAISGFSARLTDAELKSVERKPGFLHAYKDEIIPLLTTRTPAFLSLSVDGPGVWKDSNFGKGIIVGVLDTGIYGEHPSFRADPAIPPPPRKWKGSCEFNASVCNNKLIGARNYVRGMDLMKNAAHVAAPPYDTEGHGTHTAGTAAGAFVDADGVEGQAKGTASGMAPYAHLSVYKVCSESGCASSDILAGMDRAMFDGVDVMSLSLGGSSLPYYSDSIAIGAYGAMTKGVFVSCAGGNSGPGASTLSNEAPWMLTVGASTVDRNIRTSVGLGNGGRFDGESVHQPKGYGSPAAQLVYPGAGSAAARACKTLGGVNVKGKIVVCDDGAVNRVDKGIAVKNAGGAGMIIANVEVEGVNTFTDPHVLPASHVSYSDGVKIKAYIKANSSAIASIAFKGTITGSSVAAPILAYFSSRGPNLADPNILKPDIIGPGVNILAAWPFDIGTPGAKYNLISGTSMATPHLSGIAAILKGAHPNWSPAAIKSAMMTTARIVDNNNEPIRDQKLNAATFFDMGAGHVDPNKATDPGLVYDLDQTDYVSYLCGMKYTDKQVSVVVRKTVKCSDYSPVSGADLNYPSFMVFMNDDSVTVKRTVTNVGVAGSSYKAEVVAPEGVTVTVEPKILSFEAIDEKVDFTVTFSVTGSLREGYSEGYLYWQASDYSVRSPIMVSFGGSSLQSM